MNRSLVTLSLIAIASMPTPARSAEHPRELGRVHWGRDLDRTLDRSRASGKPVLILFQEIPGCATCVGFGDQVLSHPLIAEAIEDEFEPVAIYNNRDGADASALRRYREPAWNNPVMRFVGEDGRDVLPRRDGLYSAHEIALRLIEALKAARRPVPRYLEIAEEETHLAAHQTATFGMSCFWEGEARLGALPGVIATRAVFARGREAVEVVFDAAHTDYATLLREAERQQCAAGVYARTDEQFREARKVVGDRAERSRDAPREAEASDQKRHLAHSPLRSLELTPYQQTHVNAAFAAREDPYPWLSPRQRKRAQELVRAAR